jgi:hypothetical protein
LAVTYKAGCRAAPEQLLCVCVCVRACVCVFTCLLQSFENLEWLPSYPPSERPHDMPPPPAGPEGQPECTCLLRLPLSVMHDCVDAMVHQLKLVVA